MAATTTLSKLHVEYQNNRFTNDHTLAIYIGSERANIYDENVSLALKSSDNHSNIKPLSWISAFACALLAVTGIGLIAVLPLAIYKNFQILKVEGDGLHMVTNFNVNQAPREDSHVKSSSFLFFTCIHHIRS